MFGGISFVHLWSHVVSPFHGKYLTTRQVPESCWVSHPVPSLLRVASAWDTWASKANCCAAAQRCRWCCTSCPSAATRNRKRGQPGDSVRPFLGIFCGSDLLERLSDLELRDSNGYIELPQSQPINGQNKICSARSVKDVVCVFNVQRFFQKWHKWMYALQDASIMFNTSQTSACQTWAGTVRKSLLIRDNKGVEGI